MYMDAHVSSACVLGASYILSERSVTVASHTWTVVAMVRLHPLRPNKLGEGKMVDPRGLEFREAGSIPAALTNSPIISGLIIHR